MEGLVSAVIIIIVILFALTGIAAILSVVRFGKDKPLITIEKRYRDRLFNSLITEVVAVVIALGWLVVDQVRDNNREMQESNEWKVSIEEWIIASQSWIKEPSGLCNSNLRGTDSRRGPFALAVDDDEPDIFVIGSILDGLGVLKTLTFEKHEPNDLEAICWDENKWYYATTSHRRLGEGQDLTRMLLRFMIDPRRWKDPDYKIEAETRDIAQALYNYLKDSCGIVIDTVLWNKKSKLGPQWHPYALEIEGLAHMNGDLLVGLKWPLDDSGKAILLAYNWETSAFIGHATLALNGKGISALAYDSEKANLVVIANPPQKERTNNRQDYEFYLGESVGYVFNWPHDQAEPSLSHKLAGVSYPNSKLEGIALVDGEEVWLAYDGPEHLLVKETVARVRLSPEND